MDEENFFSFFKDDIEPLFLNMDKNIFSKDL